MKAIGERAQARLAEPHGGQLVNLVVPASARAALKEEARGLASLQLAAASTAWLRLLATGALSPVDRFLGRADYERAAAELRLADGTIFPVPLILPVEDAAAYGKGTRVALRDEANHLLALLTVEETFAVRAKGTGGGARFAVSGPMQVLRAPEPVLLPRLHRSAREVRSALEGMAGAIVLAADEWDAQDAEHAQRLLRRAEGSEAALLLNLPVASQRLDDFESYRRLRACEKRFRETFGEHGVLNSLELPYQENGTRGVLLKAIIHRNYGAHGYIFEANEENGGPELRELMAELGTEIHPVENGKAKQQASPGDGPRGGAGLCVWLTGLPGAGKSTIAEQLTLALMERGRRVTLLDGDVVRTHLSRGLTFSREDRDTNVQRIGFVASEIVRHEGIAVCAAVSPYRATRERVRAMMPPGRFVEVFVDTPVEVCEQRDVKGFYAKARAGQLPSFTGVDDPYEPPEQPEVRVVTCDITPDQGTRQVVDYLQREGYLGRK